MELTAEEAWALYSVLDAQVRHLLDHGYLAAAAELDQRCHFLWRRLSGQEDQDE
jgi:hypothetical protein